jgi:hypothetical protein
MKEQEALLAAKFGGLKPKKPLVPKEHKAYFDSADWAMQKEQQQGHQGGGPGAAGQTKPKTQMSNLQQQMHPEQLPVSAAFLSRLMKSQKRRVPQRAPSLPLLPPSSHPRRHL